MVTIIRATANILHPHRWGAFLPLGLGTVIHSMVGLWSSAAASYGLGGVLSGKKSVCLVAYQESDDEAVTRCMEFAVWFHVLIFIYLGVLFVLGYVILLMWFGNRASLKIILT